MRVFRDLYPVHIRLTIERLVLPDNLKCPDDDQQKDQAIAAQHDCHNPSLLKSPGPLLKSIPSEEGKTEQVVPDVKQPDIPDVAHTSTTLSACFVLPVGGISAGGRQPNPNIEMLRHRSAQVRNSKQIRMTKIRNKSKKNRSQKHNSRR
jgi:hypothetical protein